jgi:hypothetical protein
MPAERPIFTNEFCHPCSRVVWNAKVLKEEEEHRARHLNGDCLCEVIFEGEDREKRLRPRGRKGRGKGKDDTEQGEAHDTYHDGGGQDAGGPSKNSAGGQAGGYTGHLTEGDCGDHALAVVEPGGHGGHGEIAEERRDSEEHVGVQVVQVDVQVKGGDEEVNPHQYEYAGYYFGNGGQSQGSQATSPEAPSYSLYSQNQLVIGQEGAGMKFYPYENYSVEPQTNYRRIPDRRGTSLPPYVRQVQSLNNSESDQPAVVSSDMMSS